MRERICKFDNLKILLIFFVVLGHIVEFYTDGYDEMRKIFIFIYSFHMPLFMFTTGLFQKKILYYRDISWKKLFYYFYLAIFIMIMLAMIDFCFGNEVDFSLLAGQSVYWYLISVIIYSLLVPIISRVNFKYLFILSILLALFAGYDNGIGDYLYLSRSIVFFPFFYLGYYFSDKKQILIKITEKKSLKLISIIIVVIYAYLCYSKLDLIYLLRALFTGRNYYSVVVDIKKCSCLHRLLAYTISFVIGFSFLCIVPNKKIKIITNLGKRTLQVYVFHQGVIYILYNSGVFSIIEKNFPMTFVYFLMVISLIITMFLSILLFKRIMDHLYLNLFRTGEVNRND